MCVEAANWFAAAFCELVMTFPIFGAAYRYAKMINRT
jgi:hypothetical protein